MMQTLYLIRHTTPDIPAGVCYGQLDIDVADSFEDEAAAVAYWLPAADLIIASPLLRTQKLAAYLAGEKNCELRRDARLMEKHFGRWEGRRWDDIPCREIDDWSADILGYTPPDGESVQQLMQRIQALMRDLTRLPQRTIALVAHGGSIRALLAHLAAIPPHHTLNWQIDYGAVIAVRLNTSAA